MERLPNATEVRRERIGLGGVGGPGQQAADRGRLVSHLSFLKPLLDALSARGTQGLGRAGPPSDRHRQPLLPEVIVGKQGGETWQATFQVVT